MGMPFHKESSSSIEEGKRDMLLSVYFPLRILVYLPSVTIPFICAAPRQLALAQKKEEVLQRFKVLEAEVLGRSTRR